MIRQRSSDSIRQHSLEHNPERLAAAASAITAAAKRGHPPSPPASPASAAAAAAAGAAAGGDTMARQYRKKFRRGSTASGPGPHQAATSAATGTRGPSGSSGEYFKDRLIFGHLCQAYFLPSRLILLAPGVRDVEF